MSTPPLTNTANTPVNASEERPPSPKPAASSAGVGAGDSSLAPASSSSNAAAASSANALPPQADAPTTAAAKQTITIEKKGLFGLGRPTTKEVDLDTALAKKMITPERAIEQHHCTPAYLTARGYDNVKFNFAGKRGEVAYDGDLKTALKKGYITIEKAIERNFITKEQAIEGGFLKG